VSRNFVEFIAQVYLILNLGDKKNQQFNSSHGGIKRG